MLLTADLPDDPDALRAIIVDHAEERRRLADRIAELETAGTQADAEIARLSAIIAAFRRHRFGARSEQLDEDQLQLGLEDLDAAIAGIEAGREAGTARSGAGPNRRWASGYRSIAQRIWCQRRRQIWHVRTNGFASRTGC